MNPEILPEQKAQLTSWADQRDLLLRELSVLQTEKDSLVKKNKELSISNTEINEKINQSIGRLDESTKKENEYNEVVGTRNLLLEIEKTRLETRLEGLKSEINNLESQKTSLLDTIEKSKDTYNSIFEKTLSLGQVVDHVTRVSSDNTRQVELLISFLKDSVSKVLEQNEINVKKTNYVIEELPKIFFDLQRQRLTRVRI